ncbi:MAG: hypothetical protein JO041_00375 [Acidobacteria bacterium]|nr:hypothetical protein [Acidobacteriota bacterium]
MAKMGNGYGSEFHLLRYLGYHRNVLNRKTEAATGGRVIEWLDFPSDSGEKLDAEWKGVAFADSASLKSAWQEFWPQSGNVPNWDAVGRLETDAGIEFLLVEAKAHVEELRSSCGARKEEMNGDPEEERRKSGIAKIRAALESTIDAHSFAVGVERWLEPYYQYANRLAHLHFLNEHKIPARLLFIYFCGDHWAGRLLRDGRPPVCPKDAAAWSFPLQEMNHRLGLHGRSQLEQRVHKIFLPVRIAEAGTEHGAGAVAAG